MASLSLLTHYIDFPALRWHLVLNDTLARFSIGGATITIKWYGVLIAIGFLLAILYGMSRAKELGVDPDKMIDAVLVCTLVGFIGARLYYVLFCADTAAYFADPLSILKVWEGGIGIYGGVIAAFLMGLLMCRLCKLDTLTMFDLASLGFLIGQSIGRWGNFFNQEAFGANTTLPWGMTGDIIASGVNGTGYNPSLPVHPTFLYESLWCALGFVILHILSKRRYRFKGEIFCGYLVWYGAGRFMIESLRTDSLMLGTMKTSQLVAVLAIIGGILLFFVFRRRATALPATLTAADAPTLDCADTASASDPEPVDDAPEQPTDEAVAPAPEAKPEETTPTAAPVDPEEGTADGDDH